VEDIAMGSYKRPRVFDPLDLEIIDLVYEAASTQLAARHPLSNPDEESVRQEALRKLVFACAEFGSVEFDALLDKVLEQSDVMRIAQPSYSTGRVKAGGGEHNAL
jgi:hypothetical protein